MLTGVLYVVGVPIGNIFDFSSRAIFVLKNVDFIIAEDSRKICFILSFLNFRNKIISISHNNEQYIADFLINQLTNGFSCAIVSDAGTPGISDPGYFFVNSAYVNGFKVVPIPGASIVATVVSVSSFAVNKFTFDGFLPKKELYKKIYFKKNLYEERVCIFFESADRLIATIFLMKEIFSLDRLIFIAKDLTKKFEFVISFKLGDFNFEFIDFYKQYFKGEFVVLLSGFKDQLLNNFNMNNCLLEDLINKDGFYNFIFFSSSLDKSVFAFYFFDFIKK